MTERNSEAEHLNETFADIFPWLGEPPHPGRELEGRARAAALARLERAMEEAGLPAGPEAGVQPAAPSSLEGSNSSPLPGAGGPVSASASPGSGGSPGRQFLIAPAVGELRPQGVPELSVSELRRLLTVDASIKLVEKGRGQELALPEQALSRADVSDAGPARIFLAQMSDRRAGELRDQVPGVVIEEDTPLQLLTVIAPPPRSPAMDPGLIPFGVEFQLSVEVRGEDESGQPLEGVSLVLLGSLWPAQGVTDAEGRATLTLYGETAETISGLLVRPRHSYWSRWVEGANLRGGEHNVVALKPLGATLEGFPGRQRLGWGQQVMGLDRLPAQMRGAGVRVAVIDSGIEAGHADLHAADGVDYTSEAAQGWGEDSVGHGSHCAGIIAARDDESGIRGFAPDAELHALKIFPGGRTSDLINALNYCIEREIDIVNLSLGSPQRSELLGQRLAQARKVGVACIAAAGNASGPVQYPAAFDGVLAVSAVGRRDAYPTDSYHGRTAEDGEPAADGFYSARFTCFGEQIDVAGPGVAIVSTVPAGRYAAMDGTSMAAPHIAGLAALVLAHRDEIRSLPRGEERVAALFAAIKASAQPLAGGDAQRVGSGLPDVLRALRLASADAPAEPLSQDQLQQLLELLKAATAIIRGQHDSS